MTTMQIGRCRMFILAACVGSMYLFAPLAAGRAAVLDEDKVKALLRERLATLQTVADLTEKAYATGNIPFTKVIESRLAVRKAELELCETDADRIKVLEKSVAESRQLEEVVQTLVKSGQAPQREALTAKVQRLEAEIALERARPAKKP